METSVAKTNKHITEDLLRAKCLITSAWLKADREELKKEYLDAKRDIDTLIYKINGCWPNI